MGVYVTLYRQCPTCKKTTKYEGDSMVNLKCTECNKDEKKDKEIEEKKEHATFDFKSISIPKAPRDIIR